MKICYRPSPNFNARPRGTVVSAILLHATEDADTPATLHFLCDPNGKPRVSYHNLIDRDATLYNLVASEQRAWHAGVGRLGDSTNVNDISLGLSFANRNDGKEPYGDEQLAVGAALCAGWMKRFPQITMDRVVRHRDTALPVGRRTDPCPPAFDLEAFKLRILRELTGGGGCI